VAEPTGDRRQELAKHARYSLQGRLLGRVAKILRERHHRLEVLVSADHVSEAPRTGARTADLHVVIDHAARLCRHERCQGGTANHADPLRGRGGLYP
jgi:hypothetical protein